MIPHFCGDELLMLMAAIPFVGAFAHKVHAWWLRKFPKHAATCHDHRGPQPAVEQRYHDRPSSLEDFSSHCIGKKNE